FALAACAELEIDSCPMEGFDPVKVGEILGIPENEKISVMIPIGYRPENTELRPKVRFSKEELFSEIQ
ncbi:nitroreductase family protein, partial [Candidatus Gracilibacteria bacterium]|nr:nitroreductase family protein [Candidatus Gracilibacteria bacterium]